MDVDRKEWPLHPQDSYDSQQARAKPPKSDPELVRRKQKYEREGMRRTVQAVLLVHIQGHPHVLALRNQGTNSFRLPGGTLRPGESERDGLNRKMKQFVFNADPSAQCEWKVGELLTMWWCPSFEDTIYPYLPQHVARPKECIKVYQVALPERCVFSVPFDDRLVAVPFFDLFDDPKAYGQILCSIPQLSSKYAMVLFD
uniref:Cleavage and polyadenylation specificity factor subunit 5 n=1 Tax=Noctiluca scintillans TaxID=2966 RepID=A0A7S1AUS2_NOCSC|mmetsp:Transcript_59213/g.157620  ORF Transcript_59213/g.157620 Transcript_59213/m.157620 type:complete len:199 (+) Transcript_59213:67-663(+)|eukprot:CAMPEP_0194481198 /NCGR_PEP_ID=MMETSP0253-20130528/3733_1 /TAXON_ID=2966 /ORGANISM="Noctiluca scintillans" /LENGTH=198 /DNA_ID=CAMNT_0039320667 /DNA_START=62 /DNA_END=658 /DNA_ORIENTATION=+